MSVVLKIIYTKYDEIMTLYADPRSENFLLAQSPIIPICITVVYYFLVTKWGPNFMKNRAPFNLDKILIVYNLLQIILSARLFIIAARYTYIFGPYNFRCQPIDWSDDPLAMRVMKESYNFYLIKIVDLLDTVFFVLRKKQAQVTFLHVYHHAVMVFAMWMGARFTPDPRSDHYLLGKSPLIPIGISVVYYFLVTKWGPNFMKNRAPFNLDKVLIVYNLLQVILSARFFYQGVRYTYIFGPYKFRCQPIDWSDDPLAMRLVRENYNYYLIKIVDLLDTVFFVLRKKQGQVTFLHVYHHAIMVFGVWMGLRFAPDHRIGKYFLAENPFIPIGIAIIYIQFVTNWGPKFMKNRPAYNMDIILAVYNALQIILSVRNVFLGLKYGYIFGPYSFRCQPVDYSHSFEALLTAREIHNFYLIKVLDLLDTVFFILRKKQNQVTFLHLYHHGGMVLASWVACRFTPGGHVVFIGFINSFVHTVMYSYYLMALVSKSSHIWWKKYITLLQIFQFGLIAFQWALMLATPSCGFPKLWGLVLFPQNIFMTVMFVEFYYKAYIKKK